VHLGFEVAQIQFDVPAHGVEPGEFQRGIEFGLREGREQKEALGAEAVALELDDEQAAGDGIGAEVGLELVVAGVRPSNDVLAQGEWALEELARAPLGHAHQGVGAGAQSGLRDAEHAEVAVSDEESWRGGFGENNLAGQLLLAGSGGREAAIHRGPGQGAEVDHHAHQTPVGRSFGLVAVGREALGNVAQRAQAQGGPVEQADQESPPHGIGVESGDAPPLQLEDIGEKSEGQPLAGIAEGGSRGGDEFF
jgi:hypothetical protein